MLSVNLDTHRTSGTIGRSRAANPGCMVQKYLEIRPFHVIVAGPMHYLFAMAHLRKHR